MDNAHKITLSRVLEAVRLCGSSSNVPHGSLACLGAALFHTPTKGHEPALLLSLGAMLDSWVLECDPLVRYQMTEHTEEDEGLCKPLSAQGEALLERQFADNVRAGKVPIDDDDDADGDASQDTDLK